MKKPVLAALVTMGTLLSTAGAQTTFFKLVGPYNTFLTTAGTTKFPFKYYETKVAEVDKFWKDPVMNIIYTAISDFVGEHGYDLPCMSRDLYYLKGTPAQLKAMQGQWIAALKARPATFTEITRSLGDKAKDADGAPIVLDTYVLKSTDGPNEARSFSFVNYPTKNKAWVVDCRSH